MHTMCKALSVDQAVEKIKGPAKVNEVLPEVAPEDRSKVFNQLRMEKATQLELKKQATPMPGAPAGAEMQPAGVQTSAQTAMTKANVPDDFYEKLLQEMAPPPKKEEPKQEAAAQKPVAQPVAQANKPAAEDADLESMFSPAMKELEKKGEWKQIAHMALDFAAKHEAEGDLNSAKKYYKIAKQNFDQHISESNPGINQQGAKPKAVETEVPRKLSPDAIRAQQDQAKEAERVKNLPTSFSPDSRSPITRALFGEEGPQFLRDKRGLAAQKEAKNPQRKGENPWEQLKPEGNSSSAEAINRFKELRSKIQRQFADREDRANLMAEGDSPKTVSDIAGQALTDAVSPVNMPEARALAIMDAEHERNRPRTQKEKEAIANLQSQREKQLTTTERQIKQEGGVNPAPGQSIRSTPASGYIPEQTQQEHQRWFSARKGAETGQGLTGEQLKRLQGTSSENELEQEPRQRTALPPKKSGSPLVAAGDASALEARLAAEAARKQAALTEKQTKMAAAPKEIPSANESMVVSARKSMQKSAEQAKHPAFPEKSQKGEVAGVTPESDLVGDYSTHMDEQKSANDKPFAKQGFGSVEILKRARTLLKKK